MFNSAAVAQVIKLSKLTVSYKQYLSKVYLTLLTLAPVSYWLHQTKVVGRNKGLN